MIFDVVLIRFCVLFSFFIDVDTAIKDAAEKEDKTDDAEMPSNWFLVQYQTTKI